MLIGVLIAIIAAAIAWAATRREGFDNWDSLNIPGGEVKFADRSGGCSAGFTKITDGMRKGMCAPDRYVQGQPAPTPAPAPRPAPTPAPAPRPSPPRAQPPVRQQNWLEKLAELQDPLSAGKGGANAKPVEYNQGSNRRRPNITIASSGSKFRPKQGDGKCPAGFVGITSGTRKGMCIKSEYARGGTPSGPSRVSGSKFSSKVNGQCPNGFSEITAGRRKGMCIKWEYAGKSSGSRSSSPSRSSGSSGSKFISKVDGRCPSGTVEITAGSRKGICIKKEFAGKGSSRSSGSSGSKFSSKVNGKCSSGTVEITGGSRKGMCIKKEFAGKPSSSRGGSGGSGSKFSQKQNGRCPAGTVEITSGGRRGQCIKTEYSSKKAGEYLSGSKFRNKEGGRCPDGTIEVTSGGRRGQCVIDDGGFRYWGWGANQGKKCRNSNNTGCDDSYGYTKPRAVDFRYWGWGANQGKKCRNPDNTGCDDSYAYTRGKSAPAPKPRPGPSSTPLSNPSDFKYPGKGKTAGLMCKNQDGTVCDVSSRYNRNPWPYWGWAQHEGMKCKNPDNTGCSFDYAKK